MAVKLQPRPAEPLIQGRETDSAKRSGVRAVRTTLSTKLVRRDTTRAYVAVDDVGTRAVQIARSLRGLPTRCPRVVATRDAIRKAPLAQSAAFVLAFIDGATDEDALVDCTGLPIQTIRDAIESLVRLGLVELPSG